jgi:hypothetical protein
LRKVPDENWALCRIGGQMIPVQPYEVRDLYHQLRTLLHHAQGDRNAMEYEAQSEPGNNEAEFSPLEVAGTQDMQKLSFESRLAAQ